MFWKVFQQHYQFSLTCGSAFIDASPLFFSFITEKRTRIIDGPYFASLDLPLVGQRPVRGGGADASAHGAFPWLCIRPRRGGPGKAGDRPNFGVLFLAKF